MTLPLDNFHPAQVEFSIAGNPAGNLENPDVGLILKKSTPSSFGKGDKTVRDDAYRHGKEIPGVEVQFEKERLSYRMVHFIEKNISPMMFPGRTAQLKLYKLTVYEAGGHFDWHMDTTHSDEHHATVLVALNTPWEGGDFVLRRNGVETRADMKPKTGESKVILQAIAFYTDTEHKVEPVSEGVRIILQYDVEVFGWSKGGKSQSEEGSGSGDDDEESAEDSNDMDVDGGSILDSVSLAYSEHKHYQQAGPVVGDLATIKEIIVIIESLLQSGVEQVAFAMQYLYRKSSILPEFLKGSDVLLYQALVASFDVSLHPIVLSEETDYDGTYEGCHAYRFDHTSHGPEAEEEASDGSDEGSQDAMDGDDPTVFYLHNRSAIQRISYQEYYEYTGNEAQIGENKYFGGGMFVRRKSTA